MSKGKNRLDQEALPPLRLLEGCRSSFTWEMVFFRNFSLPPFSDQHFECYATELTDLVSSALLHVCHLNWEGVLCLTVSISVSYCYSGLGH